MNELVNYKKYEFNGSFHREKEDFTYTLFIDYDFSTDKQSTSFFRSDFRGARFENIKFHKNNFDRADFISCSFINTTFFDVNIAACEMKNCYYENVKFCKNHYNNTSIQECVFNNCIFEDEKILVNMKNCQFIDCIFKNLTFERSTTESIIFKTCEIFNTDFANMHAERFKFISCILEEVQIDVCYIYGYLFYNTNLIDIKIIYMGETLDFTEDNLLYKFAAKLWGRARYYEFINAYIIFGHINNVKPLLEKAFFNLIKENTPQRNLEIYNILDMMQFYISNNIFNFSTTKSILEFLETLNISALTFEEKVTYMSQLEKIKAFFSDTQYNLDFIMSAQDDISFVTFYCNSSDYNNVFKCVSQIIKQVYDSLNLNMEYTLIDAQQGSWILTFVVISSCALLLPKIINEVTHLYFEINTKQKISKRIADKLQKKSLSISELKELTGVAISSGLIDTESKKVDLKELSKIVEMIKIGI